MNRIFYSVIALFGAMTVLADNYVSTGATVTTDGDAEIYTWTDTNTVGTIVVPEGGALFDVLLVGGGGAGGWCRGGGGGGGGVVYQTGLSLSAGTYSIKVGAGGTPDKWDGSYDQGDSTEATDGRPTTVSNGNVQVRIAYGGGGGGSFSKNNTAGRFAGASSGGSANMNVAYTEVSGGQGYHGGATSATKNDYGAGGGGAGGVGGDATTSRCGDGGVGFKCAISGTDVWYGGGGGGGCYGGSSTTSGVGGQGGGGHGGYDTNADLTTGTDGLGGGGGGASGAGNKTEKCGGARGGSGIVIFRTVTEALPPSFTDVDVVVNGSNITFSSTLIGLGTDQQCTSAATSCDLYLAYGTDPDNLVSSKVKTGWTLDAPAWSMTVTDIPSYAKFYWRAALTNNYDIGADAEQSGFNLNEGNGSALPLKYGFTDSSFVLLDGGGYGNYDLPALFDGDLGRGCNLGRQVTPNVLFDAGEAKVAKLLRVYSSDSGSSLTNLMQNLSLYGSNDRETWTKLADTNDFTFGLLTTSWMKAPVQVSTAFRYFELRGVPDVKLEELELISEDMSLKFEKPTYYQTDTDLEPIEAAYDTNGVKMAGTLVMSPSTSTELYGYYADTDYDSEESDWVANGTKFTISGTFATGDTFSQKVKIPGRGQRFVRLFAKAGTKVTSSQRSWEIALKSIPKLVPAYLTFSNLYSFYDTVLDSNYDDGGAGYIIFDLRGLGKHETLSHLRMWPCDGYCQYVWSRMRCGKIYVSYDDATVTTSGETLVAGREVYAIASEPSVSWTLVKPYLDDVVNIHSLTECVYPDLSANARPTFLKVGNFYRQNCREIELRVVDTTKGMVMIIR